MSTVNPLGQSIGDPVEGWSPRPRPTARPMEGRWCRLEALDPSRHAGELYEANSLDIEGRMWTYLPFGPFEDLDDYRQWLAGVAGREDPLYFAVVSKRHDRVAGLVALQRIDPTNGSVEIGGVAFSPLLQASTAASEAISLMMRRVFDELGCRRCEWKCNALNDASRRAAERFGFAYEGTFRQAMVVKGHNRDTAWFSVTDAEWPRLRAAHEQWLAPGNFTADGRQRSALSELTRPARTVASSTGRSNGPATRT